MKAIKLLTPLIVLLLLSACKREKECPAFNSSDLEHIPYSEYDTLKFVNQQNETYSIYLQEYNLSTSFEQDCNILQFVCPCINYVELIAQNSAIRTSYSFLRMEQSDVSDMRYFKYKIMDYDFELDFENEVSYFNDFPYLDLLETFTMNNMLFHNVVIYSNTENSTSNVLKVYLNKTDGILRIETKDGSIWNKQY